MTPAPARLALLLVVWGDEYREYFTDRCLASLLAPGNLPALGEASGATAFIATTREDRAALEAHPTVERSRSHLDYRWFEIDPPRPGSNDVLHMSEAHRQLFEAAHAEGRIGINLSPDCVFSDGTLRWLLARARAGVQLVLAVVVRAEMEGFFGDLAQAGLLEPPARCESASGSLALPGSALVSATIAHPHTETRSWTWGSDGFSTHPGAVLWSDPDNDHAVLRCFEMLPLMLDFSAIGQLDLSDFSHTTYSGAFVDRHFRHEHRIEVLDDSDNGMVATWSPAAQGMTSLQSRWSYRIPMLGALSKAYWLSRRFHAAPSLKQWCFGVPVTWRGAHASRVLATRLAADRVVQRFLDAGAPRELSGSGSFIPVRDTAAGIGATARAMHLLVVGIDVLRYVLVTALRSARGDEEARRRITAWPRKALRLMTGASR